MSNLHWKLIQKCWSWKPENRPNATEVLRVIVQHPATRTKNIVLFGQTGAGKSSVVNLMAGREVARTSCDMERCTMHWEKHSVTFSGYNYKVFDTVGLEEPQLGKKEYLDIIVNAHDLITKLKEEGGIDLLLFCVRAGRFASSIPYNYRLFYEWLCEKKVPIVLVLTGLEREDNMENWWTRYKHTYEKYGVVVDGQACITAANKLNGRQQQLYELSRRLVRELVIKHTHDRQWNTYNGGETWYRRVMQKLWKLTLGNLKFTPKKENIEAVLTKRCHMDAEDARELASRIRYDLCAKPQMKETLQAEHT